MAHPTAPPIALLLVPRTVERFILYDQGQDLLRAPGVVGVDAPRVPYGALGRLPDWLGDALASAQARRLRLDGDPVVAMMFHPFQLPFAVAFDAAGLHDGGNVLLKGNPFVVTASGSCDEYHRSEYNRHRPQSGFP